MQFVRTLLLKWFCILLIRKYSIAFVLPLLGTNKKFSMQRVTIHLTGKPFDQPFIFFLAHRFKKDNGMIFMVNKRIRWLWCGLWLSGEREHFNIWYSRIWFRLHGSFGSQWCSRLFWLQRCSVNLRKRICSSRGLVIPCVKKSLLICIASYWKICWWADLFLSLKGSIFNLWTRKAPKRVSYGWTYFGSETLLTEEIWAVILKTLMRARCL